MTIPDYTQRRRLTRPVGPDIEAAQMPQALPVMYAQDSGAAQAIGTAAGSVFRAALAHHASDDEEDFGTAEERARTLPASLAVKGHSPNPARSSCRRRR
jgi:hypothetical protein